MLMYYSYIQTKETTNVSQTILIIRFILKKEILKFKFHNDQEFELKWDFAFTTS
jgi:hypothetical protein